MAVPDPKDALWRQAARALGLRLFDAAGKRVPRSRATHEHTMRGELEGHAVTARYLGRARRGFRVRVPLHHPLLLGADIRMSPPIIDAGGRFVGAPQLDVGGADEDRLQALTRASSAGREMMEIFEALRGVGLIALSDTAATIECEFDLERAEEYIAVIHGCARIASLAETARAELPEDERGRGPRELTSRRRSLRPSMAP